MKSFAIAGIADLRAIEAGPARSYMGHLHVHDALADVARRHGGRPALCALAHAEDAAPRRWTHAELLADVRRAANLFRTLAAGEQARVALLLPPLPEAWMALWGAETAGVACPINHALGDEQIAALLRAAGANLVVTLAPGHVAGDIGARVTTGLGDWRSMNCRRCATPCGRRGWWLPSPMKPWPIRGRRRCCAARSMRPWRVASSARRSSLPTANLSSGSTTSNCSRSGWPAEAGETCQRCGTARVAAALFGRSAKVGRSGGS